MSDVEDEVMDGGEEQQEESPEDEQMGEEDKGEAGEEEEEEEKVLKLGMIISQCFNPLSCQSYTLYIL